MEKVNCSMGRNNSTAICHPRNFDENGKPWHSMLTEMYSCSDSRKEECPYALTINVQTEYVLINKTYCLYMHRKALS